ncbi:MAG: stage II sporulation protein M [Firmicutes bacterium]|nr:stage II sporulation protein M [Bacillota bacterium]
MHHRTELISVLGNYIRKHMLMYVIIITMLVMGTIFGAIAAKILPENEKAGLFQDLIGFFSALGSTTQTSAVSASHQGFFGNLKTVLIGWILGLSVIGAPGIGVLVFLRGFIIGFTVGFLILQMSGKGIILAIISILPQNIFIIPALIFSCESSLAFSKAVIKNRLRNMREPLYPRFMLSCIAVICSIALLGIASIVEGFITPVFIQLVSRHM